MPTGSKIAADYVRLAELIDSQLELPPVRAVHIAAYCDDPEKSSKFGALELADGTIGLTYTGLDGTLLALQDATLSEPLIGASPLQAARLYTGDSAWQRSLGMAAVNAISQFVFKQCDYPLPAAGRTLEQLALHADDRVGMVGYFPPLVEAIRARALPLTVVELDPRWWCRSQDFEVTGEAARLRDCTRIVCTGTVLVNHTADDVLAHCRNAETVLIAGPTVGCLPDPLFARGVTLVGGCTVADTPQFLQRWRAQDKWRKSTRRYRLDSSYPGCRELLAAEAAKR